jgi:hypothetical protein
MMKSVRMRRFIRKHKAISAILAVILVVLVVLFAGTWFAFAGIRGDLAARIDLRLGRYQQLGYGLPHPSQPEYVRCLREKYNVEYRAVDDCTVSLPVKAYADAYDAVVADAMNRKYGRSIFKECAVEADKKWKMENEASGLSSTSAR